MNTQFPITEAEIKVVARLLYLARNYFCSRSCSDFDLNFLSVQERRTMIKECELHNGTPEEYNPEGDYSSFFHWVLMGYLSSKLDPEFYSEVRDGDTLLLPRGDSARDSLSQIIDKLRGWSNGSVELSLPQTNDLIEQLALAWCRYQNSK